MYEHFPFSDPPKFTQIGIFGLKTNHLATLQGPGYCACLQGNEVIETIFSQKLDQFGRQDKILMSMEWVVLRRKKSSHLQGICI
jgi:hypothetical protein